MAKELLERLEGSSVSKKKALTILIFAFGIAMFISGVSLGKYVQYEQELNNVAWYENNCACNEQIPIITEKAGLRVNNSFLFDVYPNRS